MYMPRRTDNLIDSHMLIRIVPFILWAINVVFRENDAYVLAYKAFQVNIFFSKLIGA